MTLFLNTSVQHQKIFEYVECKVGAEQLINIHHLTALTAPLCFPPVLSPLVIMWRNWAIPTSGFRLWEDSIFPTTPQRWDDCPRTGQNGTSLCASHAVSFSFFPRSGCTWRKLPERQSDGEHHEAPEGTTPVPPGFVQTVCFFG